MGYSNKEDAYWTAISLAVAKNGDSLETRNQSSGVLALTWTGATATDAVAKLQESVDGTTWFDVATMSQTINAAAGSKLFKLTRDILLSPYLRVVLTPNSESTGTTTIKFSLKGDR